MDNMDNFFREVAQNHNLEFNESDWLQLKNQLDKEMPVGFSLFNFLKKFGIGILVFVILPATWLTFQAFSEKDSKEPTVSSMRYELDKPVINDGKSQVVADIEHSEGRNMKVLGNNSIVEKNSDEFAKESGESLLIEEGHKYEAEEKSGVEIKNNGQVVLGEGADSDRHNVGEQLLFLSSISPEFLITPSITEVNHVEEILELLPNRKSKSFLKVGAGYSPDFSTVGIGNFVSPGSRWSATAEFGFLGRFVLNTGIVYVNNKYEAYGEDYHAPSRYWQKGIVANEAYGECQMIDIPLNLRYNVIVGGRNMVFISAGVSTYFVTKEDYYFHYEIDDPDLPDHWGTDKTTIYPFGIMNFSFGFEHEFTRRSGLQIEPFIKIPTTGIGWGNVDLHTMGIYFMYKHKL